MSDIFAGLCAGITQTAVGHPFDTMKVLLQNKQQFKHYQTSLNMLYYIVDLF